MTGCGGSAVPQRPRTSPPWALRKSGCRPLIKAPRRRMWATAYMICMIWASSTRRERSAPSTAPRRNTWRPSAPSTRRASAYMPTSCSTTAWAGTSWRRSPPSPTTPTTAGSRSATSRPCASGRSSPSPAATAPTANSPGTTATSPVPTGMRTPARPATSIASPASTGIRPTRRRAPSTT